MRAILLSEGKERDIYFLEEVTGCIEDRNELVSMIILKNKSY